MENLEGIGTQSCIFLRTKTGEGGLSPGKKRETFCRQGRNHLRPTIREVIFSPQKKRKKNKRSRGAVRTKRLTLKRKNGQGRGSRWDALRGRAPEKAKDARGFQQGREAVSQERGKKTKDDPLLDHRGGQRKTIPSYRGETSGGCQKINRRTI